MELRGFSLTKQTYVPKPFPGRKMSDPDVYSYPLTGHLDSKSPVSTATWSFPPLAQHFKAVMPLGMIPSPSAIGKISCVVGGFVGSKSQRNGNNEDLFPLGKLITKSLEEQRKLCNNSSHEANFMQSMMSSLFISRPAPPDPELLKSLRTGVPDLKKEEVEVPRRDVSASTCIGAAIRLLSECSVESNDSDFIVFDGGEVCQITDDEDDWTDDDCEYEDEEDKRIREACEKWNAYYGSAPALDEGCSFAVPPGADHVCSPTLPPGADHVCSSTLPPDADHDFTPVPDRNCDGPAVPPEIVNAVRPPAPDLDSKKRVRFKPDADVHVMRVWDFASRAARVGPWEEAARDRARFAQRVARTGEILAPILTQTHRDKIRTTLRPDR